MQFQRGIAFLLVVSLLLNDSGPGLTAQLNAPTGPGLALFDILKREALNGRAAAGWKGNPTAVSVHGEAGDIALDLLNRREALTALFGGAAAAIPSTAQTASPQGAYHPAVDADNAERWAARAAAIAENPALADAWHTGHPPAAAAEKLSEVHKRIIDANPAAQKSWIRLLAAIDRFLAVASQNTAWTLTSDQIRAPAIRFGDGQLFNLRDIVYFPQYQTSTPFFSVESLRQPPGKGFFGKLHSIARSIVIEGGVQFNSPKDVLKAIQALYVAAADLRVAFAEMEETIDREVRSGHNAWYALARHDLKRVKNDLAQRQKAKLIQQVREGMSLGIDDPQDPDRIRLRRMESELFSLQRDRTSLDQSRIPLQQALLQHMAWRDNDGTLDLTVEPYLPQVSVDQSLVETLLQLPIPGGAPPGMSPPTNEEIQTAIGRKAAASPRLTTLTWPHMNGRPAAPLDPAGRAFWLESLWPVEGFRQPLTSTLPRQDPATPLDLLRLFERFTTKNLALLPSPTTVKLGFLAERGREQAELMKLDKQSSFSWGIMANWSFPMLIRPWVKAVSVQSTTRLDREIHAQLLEAVVAIDSDIRRDQIGIRSEIIGAQQQGLQALARAQQIAAEIVRLKHLALKEFKEPREARPDFITPALEAEMRTLDLIDSLYEAAALEEVIALRDRRRLEIREAMVTQLETVTRAVDALRPGDDPALTGPGFDAPENKKPGKKVRWLPRIMNKAILPPLGAWSLPAFEQWPWGIVFLTGILLLSLGLPFLKPKWFRSGLSRVIFSIATGGIIAISLMVMHAAMAPLALAAGILYGWVLYVLIPGSFSHGPVESYLHHTRDSLMAHRRGFVTTGIAALVAWVISRIPWRPGYEVAKSNITQQSPTPNLGMSLHLEEIPLPIPPGETGRLVQAPVAGDVSSGSPAVAWTALPTELRQDLESIVKAYPEQLPAHLIVDAYETPQGWALLESAELPGSVEDRLRTALTRYATAERELLYLKGLADSSRRETGSSSSTRREQFWNGERRAIALWVRGLLEERKSRDVRAAVSFSTLPREGRWIETGSPFTHGQETSVGRQNPDRLAHIDLWLDPNQLWLLGQQVHHGKDSQLRMEILDIGLRKDKNKAEYLYIPIKNILHLAESTGAADPTSGGVKPRITPQIHVDVTLRWPGTEPVPQSTVPMKLVDFRAPPFETWQTAGLAWLEAQQVPHAFEGAAEALDLQVRAHREAIEHYASMRRILSEDIDRFGYDIRRANHLLELDRQAAAQMDLWKRQLAEITSRRQNAVVPGYRLPPGRTAANLAGRWVFAANPIRYLAYPFERIFRQESDAHKLLALDQTAVVYVKASVSTQEQLAFQNGGRFRVWLPGAREALEATRYGFMPSHRLTDQVLFTLRLEIPQSRYHEFFPANGQAPGMMPVRIDLPNGGNHQASVGPRTRRDWLRIPLRVTSLGLLGSILLQAKNGTDQAASTPPLLWVLPLAVLGMIVFSTLRRMRQVRQESAPEGDPLLQELGGLLPLTPKPALPQNTGAIIARMTAHAAQEPIDEATLLHLIRKPDPRWSNDNILKFLKSRIVAMDAEQTRTLAALLQAQGATADRIAKKLQDSLQGVHFHVLKNTAFSFYREGSNAYVTEEILQSLADESPDALALVFMDLLMNPRYNNPSEPVIRGRLAREFQETFDSLWTPETLQALSAALVNVPPESSSEFLSKDRRPLMDDPKAYEKLKHFQNERYLPHEWDVQKGGASPEMNPKRAAGLMYERFKSDGLSRREALTLVELQLLEQMREQANRKTTHYVIVFLSMLAMLIIMLSIPKLFPSFVAALGVSMTSWTTIFRDALGQLPEFSLQAYVTLFREDFGTWLFVTLMLILLGRWIGGFIVGQIEKPWGEFISTGRYHIKRFQLIYIRKARTVRDRLIRDTRGLTRDNLSVADTINQILKSERLQDDEAFRKLLEEFAFALVHRVGDAYRQMDFNEPTEEFRHMARVVQQYARSPLHPDVPFFRGDALQAPKQSALDAHLAARGTPIDQYPEDQKEWKRENALVARIMFEMERHPVPALLALISYDLTGLAGDLSESDRDLLESLRLRLATLAPEVFYSSREFARYHQQLRLHHFALKTLREQDRAKLDALLRSFEDHEVVMRQEPGGKTHLEIKAWQYYTHKIWHQDASPVDRGRIAHEAFRSNLMFPWIRRLYKNHPQAADELLDFLQRNEPVDNLEFLRDRLLVDETFALPTSIGQLLSAHALGSSLLREYMLLGKDAGIAFMLGHLFVYLDQALLVNLREAWRFSDLMTMLTGGRLTFLNLTEVSRSFMENLKERLSRRPFALDDAEKRVDLLDLREAHALRSPSTQPLIISSADFTDWALLQKFTGSVVFAVPNPFLVYNTIILATWHVWAGLRDSRMDKLQSWAGSRPDRRERVDQLLSDFADHHRLLARFGIQFGVFAHSDENAKTHNFPPFRLNVSGAFVPDRSVASAA